MFVGHFCPPGSGSGYGSRYLIESGSTALLLTFLDSIFWSTFHSHKVRYSGMRFLFELQSTMEKYDFVIHGASGFTGQFVVEYVYRATQEHGKAKKGDFFMLCLQHCFICPQISLCRRQCCGSGSTCFRASWIRIHKSEVWITKQK
jgi:hypothetical protein